MSHSIMSHFAGMFYVINRSIGVFMFFGDTISNFVCTHLFASVISRLSSVFVFPEQGYMMCRKRFEFRI